MVRMRRINEPLSRVQVSEATGGLAPSVKSTVFSSSSSQLRANCGWLWMMYEPVTLSWAIPPSHSGPPETNLFPCRRIIAHNVVITTSTSQLVSSSSVAHIKHEAAANQFDSNANNPDLSLDQVYSALDRCRQVRI